MSVASILKDLQDGVIDQKEAHQRMADLLRPTQAKYKGRMEWVKKMQETRAK